MTGTPVAGLIVLHPGVELKAVEGDPLFSNRDLGQVGAYLAVETIAVHPEVEGRVAKPNKPRNQGGTPAAPVHTLSGEMSGKCRVTHGFLPC